MEKKEYKQPIIEIVEIESEDILSSSAKVGPDWLFDGDNIDSWDKLK